MTHKAYLPILTPRKSEFLSHHNNHITHKAVALAVNLCKKGGQTIIIGTSVEPLETIRPAELILSEVEIKPSFVSGEEELFSFLKFLSAGKINTEGMLTEVVRLDDIPEVMERLSKTAIPVRVAVKP